MLPGFDVGQLLPRDKGVVAAHLPDRRAHLSLVLVHQLVVLLLLVGARSAAATVETGARDTQSDWGESSQVWTLMSPTIFS